MIHVIRANLVQILYIYIYKISILYKQHWDRKARFKRAKFLLSASQKFPNSVLIRSHTRENFRSPNRDSMRSRLSANANETGGNERRIIRERVRSPTQHARINPRVFQLARRRKMHSPSSDSRLRLLIARRLGHTWLGNNVRGTTMR